MIRIENLSRIYGHGEGKVTALKNVDLTINDGELVAIIGKSGSGKTTLLNLMGGLDMATSEKVSYDSYNITDMGDTKLSDFRLKHIGFVFQFYDLLAELTAEENILLPARLANNKKTDFSGIVKRLGISDRIKHYPSQLSGGQQQRVAIARALVNNPKVLLCDEPTGNLDEKSGNEVMEMLTELNKRDNHTIIIVTHNPEIAEKCDRVIQILNGGIVSYCE